jgi:signal peptidase I
MSSKDSFLHERKGPGPAQRLTHQAGPGVLSLFEDLLNGGSDLRVRVTGRSMRPFLRGGEVLTLRKVPGPSLKKGDLILFRNRDGFPLLHRIVHATRKVSGTIAFQTKGDALTAFDGPVSDHEVLGKVCRIEKGSKTINMETGAWIKLNYLIAVVSLIQSRFFSTLHAFRNLI